MLTATVDKSGRIVIPKHLRDRLELHPGTAVSVRLRDDAVVVKRAARQPAIVRKDGVLVFTGRLKKGYSAQDIIRAVDRLRHERMEQIAGMKLPPSPE